MTGKPIRPLALAMRLWALLALGLWALPCFVACGQSGRSTAPGLEITPIQIESVDVLVQESSPPRASARVRGVIGDGCATLHSVEQERSGNRVTLVILRERPADAICIQLARLYDETIPLEGTYPRGTYSLRVNDLETSFTTE